MALVYKVHIQVGSDNTASLPHNHPYISSSYSRNFSRLKTFIIPPPSCCTLESWDYKPATCLLKVLYIYNYIDIILPNFETSCQQGARSGSSQCITITNGGRTTRKTEEKEKHITIVGYGNVYNWQLIF